MWITATETFLPVGVRPLELAGVRPDEAASRDAAWARHSSNPIGSELPTSTTTRGDTSASNVDVSWFSIDP